MLRVLTAIRYSFLVLNYFQQRNLKQKFISLLKRFRVNEDLQALDNDQETISRKLSGKCILWLL